MTLMPLRNDAQRRPRYLLQPSVTLVKPCRAHHRSPLMCQAALLCPTENGLISAC
jgi:hypothetical protein